MNGTRYDRYEDEIILDGFGHRKSDREIASLLAAAGFSRTPHGIKKRRLQLGWLRRKAAAPMQPSSERMPRSVLFAGEYKFVKAMLKAKREGTERVRLGVVKSPGTSRAMPPIARVPGFVPTSSCIEEF